MKDVMVILRDQPGALAHMGNTLGKAGVNIEGIGGTQYGDKGIVHILVEDAEKAQTALRKVGINVLYAREVLIIGIKDKPGALGKVAQKLTDANINIDLVYLSTKNKLVMGVDDIDHAQEVLSGM